MQSLVHRKLQMFLPLLLSQTKVKFNEKELLWRCNYRWFNSIYRADGFLFATLCMCLSFCFTSHSECEEDTDRVCFSCCLHGERDAQRKSSPRSPICVCTLGCQRWLMPCVLKAEAWRFSSVLTRVSNCAANCLGLWENRLCKWTRWLFACEAQIWCSLLPPCSTKEQSAASL